MRVCVCLCVCRCARTCDCDAASREHLYSSFEMFDPVRYRRMKLWFITDKHTNTRLSTTHKRLSTLQDTVCRHTICCHINMWIRGWLHQRTPTHVLAYDHRAQWTLKRWPVILPLEVLLSLQILNSYKWSKCNTETAIYITAHVVRNQEKLNQNEW